MSPNSFTYAVNISLKNKFVYVETPKVACSTIKLSLIANELENDDPEFTGGENLGELHMRGFSPLLTPKQVGSFTDLLEKAVALVQGIYAQDFEYFGYSLDLAAAKLPARRRSFVSRRGKDLPLATQT